MVEVIDVKFEGALNGIIILKRYKHKTGYPVITIQMNGNTYVSPPCACAIDLLSDHDIPYNIRLAVSSHLSIEYINENKINVIISHKGIDGIDDVKEQWNKLGDWSVEQNGVSDQYIIPNGFHDPIVTLRTFKNSEGHHQATIRSFSSGELIEESFAHHETIQAAQEESEKRFFSTLYNWISPQMSEKLGWS